MPIQVINLARPSPAHSPFNSKFIPLLVDLYKHYHVRGASITPLYRTQTFIGFRQFDWVKAILTVLTSQSGIVEVPNGYYLIRPQGVLPLRDRSSRAWDVKYESRTRVSHVVCRDNTLVKPNKDGLVCGYTVARNLLKDKEIPVLSRIMKVAGNIYPRRFLLRPRTRPNLTDYGLQARGSTDPVEYSVACLWLAELGFPSPSLSPNPSRGYQAFGRDLDMSLPVDRTLALCHEETCGLPELEQIRVFNLVSDFL